VTLFDDLVPAPPTAPGEPSVRVRLQIAYDGRRFHGFAAQGNRVRTVAGVLASAMARVMRLPDTPALACAGRTDAGVHAWDQWVHADLPATAGEDLPGLQRRLLRLLAPELVVRSASVAPEGWDARRTAVSRTYRYTVLTTPTPDPFRTGFVWWHAGPLDRRAMDLASDALIGEHDFASFCRRHADTTLVRRVLAAGWTEPDYGTLVFEITANAFCQQMVRSIVGTLVEMGSGRRPPGDMLATINAHDRAVAGTVAPPDGLVLWAVEYPPDPLPSEPIRPETANEC
jgi:tRNA pseudouridine38-40 synthase